MTPYLTANSFATSDGVSLPLRQWLPEENPRTVIVALHGFNDYGNAFADIGAFFTRHGIAVLAYVPFGRTRLWRRVAGRKMPTWTTEFGANTWAQFFIKYVAAHPAITVVTPATSKPKHMLDNLAAGVGELPDETTRRRMERLIESLPLA